MSSTTREGFIIVHVGAGQHSASLKDRYEKICKEACEKGLECLKQNNDVQDAATEATMVLENCPITNAGYGSNLTTDGKVECDASLMEGQNMHFGAVGAASGIKNPISAARSLCQFQSIKREFGMVSPSFLVGTGATAWAKSAGIDVVSPDSLITDKAERIFHRCKRKLETAQTEKQARQRMDTVGAVCVDEFGNVAAACSSGGILLKYPGRVGQAGVWGCGVWAKKSTDSVGVSTSGCGEQIIRTILARTVAEAIENVESPIEALNDVMKTKFIDSELLRDSEEKFGGLIAVKYNAQNKCGDVLWCHTTKSMIIGYKSSKDKFAKSHMSKLDGTRVGKDTIIEGSFFSFSKAIEKVDNDS